MGHVSLTYGVGDVSKTEAAKMVDQLERDGVISKTEEWGRGYSPR